MARRKPKTNHEDLISRVSEEVPSRLSFVCGKDRFREIQKLTEEGSYATVSDFMRTFWDLFVEQYKYANLSTENGPELNQLLKKISSLLGITSYELVERMILENFEQYLEEGLMKQKARKTTYQSLLEKVQSANNRIESGDS